MELARISSRYTYEYPQKSVDTVRESFAETSGRCHSDYGDFSALSREIARAAAEKKKALLSERPQLDCRPDNKPASITSDDIKAAVQEIANSAEKNTAETPKSVKNTDESNSSAPVQNNQKDTTQKTIAEMVKEQTEKLDNFLAEREYNKNNDKKLSDIRQKMRQGRTLSSYEQQYLAAKDPDAYSSFQKINSARKMFRCTLNSCRTKDDVISMRLSNALTALSEYRKAIRKGDSGDAVVGLNAAFENELRDFAGTSGFKKLPTAAECNKFDRDIAKARKFEQEKRLEKRRLAAAKKYKKKKKAAKTPGDGKRTVAQVLADPTSKKVLASRAKHTYCTCSMSYGITKRMNSKA